MMGEFAFEFYAKFYMKMFEEKNFGRSCVNLLFYEFTRNLKAASR